MTLRDLTEDQVRAFQLECEIRMEERIASRPVTNPINPIDYKLFFSDGVKAVLAKIQTLP